MKVGKQILQDIFCFSPQPMEAYNSLPFESSIGIEEEG